MIAAAKSRDLPTIVALLASVGLCHDDLTSDSMAHFLTILEGDEVVGAVGLQVFEGDALLRSLIVAPSHRGQGLGIRLVDGIEAHANDIGVTSLYLLTTTADRFFDRHGYDRIERASVPEAVRATTEFVSFCPDSAVCMRKRLV